MPLHWHAKATVVLYIGMRGPSSSTQTGTSVHAYMPSIIKLLPDYYSTTPGLQLAIANVIHCTLIKPTNQYINNAQYMIDIFSSVL